MAFAALLGLQASLPACADPEAGRAVFEARCQQCHRGGPGALPAPPSRVTVILRQGTEPAHRFHLDDAQLQDLEAYLTEVKASGR